MPFMTSISQVGGSGPSSRSDRSITIMRDQLSASLDWWLQICNLPVDLWRDQEINQDADSQKGNPRLASKQPQIANHRRTLRRPPLAFNPTDLHVPAAMAHPSDTHPCASRPAFVVSVPASGPHLRTRHRLSPPSLSSSASSFTGRASPCNKIIPNQSRRHRPPPPAPLSPPHDLAHARPRAPSLHVTATVTSGADASDRAAAAEAAAAAADGENSASNARGSGGGMQWTDAEQDANRAYPLAAVVGNDAVKQALLLAAVNPRIGGVGISGRRGTAKSIMARAIHALLPPIEVVTGSYFNEEPPPSTGSEKDDEVDPTRQVIPAPFVQVPLNVTEDRLVGSVDVEKSVRTGRTEFQPGLLARAHRGVLYIDELNLLDDGLANILLEVISSGIVRVEREGLSIQHACRPLVIATYNPEEGDVRPHLLDRLAINLSVDAAALSMEQRIDAVERATLFADNPDELLSTVGDPTDQMSTAIVLAREYIRDVTLTLKQMEYLVIEAARAACQGHRAEIFAMQIARAAAALDSREQVSADDLKTGVKLAILPRSLIMNNQQPMDEDDMEAPPPPPPPPKAEEEQVEEEEQEEQEEQEQEEEDDGEEEVPEVPEEFMFDPEGVALDPDLLDVSKSQKQGNAGGRGLIFSQDRGRYIKAMLPRPGVQRLAVDATLRASAPYQKARRLRAAAAAEENKKKGVEDSGKNGERKVFVEESDMRIKRLVRKAGALIIFLVDASGSMALNRMNAAKGAAIRLLTEAYQTRDKVSLIPFQGNRAEVILPPTKSITMAKKRLETMPCGGGSPLAHGLMQAVRTGMNAQKSGDVGKVMIVCISDGRANVPLSVSEGTANQGGGDDEEKQKDSEQKMTKKEMKEETLNLARQIGALPGFNLICIDTENKFVSTGVAKELAGCANGSYHSLPKATDQSVANVASQAIGTMRGVL